MPGADWYYWGWASWSYHPLSTVAQQGRGSHLCTGHLSWYLPPCGVPLCHLRHPTPDYHRTISVAVMHGYKVHLSLLQSEMLRQNLDPSVKKLGWMTSTSCRWHDKILASCAVMWHQIRGCVMFSYLETSMVELIYGCLRLGPKCQCISHLLLIDQRQLNCMGVYFSAYLQCDLFPWIIATGWTVSWDFLIIILGHRFCSLFKAWHRVIKWKDWADYDYAVLHFKTKLPFIVFRSYSHS